MASKLSLCFTHDEDATFPIEVVLAFFRRLAELGHLTELSIRFDFYFDHGRCTHVPVSIARELICTVLANGSLEVLDLSFGDGDLNWDRILSTIFEGITDHKTLRAFRVSVDSEKEAFGPNLSHLRELLTNNRDITETDHDGEIHSDGLLIDALYALNRFYRGSVKLGIEPPSERSSLIVTSLMKCASNTFQRSALLMSDHVDALCELVQFAPFEDEVDKDRSSSSHSHQGQVDEELEDDSLTHANQDQKRRRML